ARCRRHDSQPGRVRRDVEQHAAVPRGAGPVEGQSGVAGGVVRVTDQREVLKERWLPVTPRAATIEGVVEAAVVEANPAVVLSGDDVAGITRVDRDLFLRLTAKGAVLVEPRVGRTSSVGAAERSRGRV